MYRAHRVCRVVLAALVLCAISFTSSLASSTPSAYAQPAAPSGPFRPPVIAPVRDPFRPPRTPYGPGNRGIEYATEPGQAVAAAGAGVVSFAGVIAAERYVSIDHGGGLRTTYSYLLEIAVVEGQVVGVGQVIGRAGERLHFGAIRSGRYIDPATLFAIAGERRARLVPIARSWT